MSTKLRYTQGKLVRACVGCGSDTRGLIEVAPLIIIPFCPRCRDTKAKHEILKNRFNLSGDLIILGDLHHEPTVPVIDQIQPQKGVSIRHLKPSEAESIKSDSANWIHEPKIDGARVHIYFTKQGIRILSSRKSKKTGHYSDRTENFSHLSKDADSFAIRHPDTVLDGELYITKTDFQTKSSKAKGTLNATVALMNCSPATAITLQEKNDSWARLVIWDCLRLRGKDIRDHPLYERRNLAWEIVDHIKSSHILFIDNLCPDLKYANSHAEAFKNVVSCGFEGLMLKEIHSPYYAPSKSARNKKWVKWKSFESHDGFVSGYIPGEAGNIGLVGALVVSQYQKFYPAYQSVKPHVVLNAVEIAAVSNFTAEERAEMSHPDGSLKKEYYSRVLEVRGQEWTRNNRLRHAVMLRWRPDKRPQDCDYTGPQ